MHDTLSRAHDCDVAIVGGGPAGSALGSLLRIHRPSLSVRILEREVFPREHVGESLLPYVCSVLNEMGVWEEVERANFPIKIGATYRWGTTHDLWDFEFMPAKLFTEFDRPGSYQGQRTQTSWQVDRAQFDKILLDHARKLGCECVEGIGVAKVERDGDRILNLQLSDGSSMTAKHYVDASGNAAVIRRAMGVQVDEPTSLQNVAFWDYWENTEWAVTVGSGATRVLVLSLPYGWIWFIPLGPTKTSIGLVCPAKHYKQMGLSPAQLYEKAIQEEPKIRELTANATREGQVRGTKDWSFLSRRLVGENWYLAGESAGFADPILSAGMTLTMSGARELAYTIAEIDRGGEDAQWLKQAYEQIQTKRIGQHIRFADFWYSANGQFTDLKEFTRELARESGLELDADRAFQWLGTGGFTQDAQGVAGLGETSLKIVKQLAQRLTSTTAGWKIAQYSAFRPVLKDSISEPHAVYEGGRVRQVMRLVRGNRIWPLDGIYGLVFQGLRATPGVEGVGNYVASMHMRQGGSDPKHAFYEAMFTLEALANEGWVEGYDDPRFKPIPAFTEEDTLFVHRNVDVAMPEPPSGA